MTQPEAVLIDCDPGIDDGVALALAVCSPEIELRCVTTVSGNAPVVLTTQNALQLLRAFGRADVPVAAGATRALVRTTWHGQRSPHGENAIGGVELPGRTPEKQPEHAVARLAATLLAADAQSVTIVAIGPLTNLALLLALHPECADRVRRVVVMGGSTGPGNITPAAEFNIWTDPEAAYRVLADSGLDVCLVGLDVTRRATLDEHHCEQLRAQSAQGALLADMIRGYGDKRPDGWPLHDVLAVAAVVDPTIIQSRPVNIEVNTGVGSARGQTSCTFVDRGPAGPKRRGGATKACQLAVDLDVGRFRALVMSRVAGPPVSARQGWLTSQLGALPTTPTVDYPWASRAAP